MQKKLSLNDASAQWCALGIRHRQQLWRIEHGEARPTPALVRHLAATGIVDAADWFEPAAAAA